jgi:biotin carboxyl carrier protein
MMKMTFGAQTIEIKPLGGGNYAAVLDGREVPVQLLRAENGRMHLLIDGRRVAAHVSSEGAKRWVTADGQTFLLTKSSGARNRAGGHHHGAGELTAPMPGQIRAVHVREGDRVAKGQTLMLLEAMKMEIRIQSPMDGRVKSLHVTQGQTVERGQMLIEMED